MRDRKRVAAERFAQGFNCAQATLCAFADDAGIDERTALLLSSSFGGGMGMKGACGALTGMFMAAGLLRGFAEPDQAGKRAHQASIKDMAETFRERFGALDCRDLLKLLAENPPPPGANAGARPCQRFVQGAVEILEERLNNERKH
ncbi:MAG: C-GCAxxG-C-C family protein [Planctomycetota bacterium]|jgi:C_GCAxxG_C_C family probable redox protein|nr:C-GCAxxG-C-C family protein [Planctomycetota bacterium]